MTTKIKANATMDQNRDYRQIAVEILREAEEVDRQEDELYGDARGDELPNSCAPVRAARPRWRRPSAASRSAKAAPGAMSQRKRCRLIRSGR